MHDFLSKFYWVKDTLKTNLDASKHHIKKDEFKDDLLYLKKLLDQTQAVYLIAMGKNHPVADAAARTFRSLGKPAFAFDAADIPHGDLGLVKSNNLNIAISKSGKTEEIVNLIKNDTIDFLLTSNFEVEYPGKCTTLRLPCPYEGDGYNIIPVTSPLIYLNFLNSVALAYAEDSKGISNVYQDFKSSHPGGEIGKQDPAS